MRVHLGWAFLLALSAAAGGYAAADTAQPPKGYLVAEIEVTDPEAYKSYAVQAGPAITACGGRYLARGGMLEALEGAAPRPRFVIVEFNSMEAARACYHSPEYQAVAPIRWKASASRFWLAEGLPD